MEAAKAAIAGLVAPAVTLNAEVTRPLLVLPKPIISMNVPVVNAGRAEHEKLPKNKPPIVILPTVRGAVASQHLATC
jgi:hypothetical protein